jgi:putative Mg2+ transporter-C (MgtC) family protein
MMHEHVLAELGRLLAAVAGGALIGLERELAGKPAGFRTNILICVGAALFTLLSIDVAGAPQDQTRIAAQIVTGVGFLGAGAILRQRGRVVGLTTAATIWVVAAVGMAFGAGAYGIGTLATLLTTGVLFGLRTAEERIHRGRVLAGYHIELEPSDEAHDALARILREARVQRHAWRPSRRDGKVAGRLHVRGHGDAVSELERALLREPSLRSVRRL